MDGPSPKAKYNNYNNHKGRAPKRAKYEKSSAASASSTTEEEPAPILDFTWGQLNVDKLHRNVFMVKLPHYLADAYDNVGPNQEIGRMRIPRALLSIPVTATPGESMATKKRKREEDDQKLRSYRGVFVSTNPAIQEFNDKKLPKEHKMIFASTPGSFCFSETEQGQFVAQGVCPARWECQPDLSPQYRQVLKSRAEFELTKQRPSKLTEEAVPVRTVRPVAKKIQRKPEIADKMIRIGKDELIKQIFQKFNESERWTLKELREATQQPAQWLKEVLQPLCIYNKKGPNKNTFQLKPEYDFKRHAQNAATNATTTTTTPAPTL